MTIKNKVIKMYHKDREIEVTASSLTDFNAGNRTTIDHILMYESVRQIVSVKPPVRDYSNYKIYQDRLKVIPFPDGYFGSY